MGKSITVGGEYFAILVQSSQMAQPDMRRILSAAMPDGSAAAV